jgi:carbon storage regulator
MLVLSRHKNTEVIISIDGVEVTVVVVEIMGDKVRLGFAAPKEVTIHRREVYDAIKAGRTVIKPINKEAKPNVSDH